MNESEDIMQRINVPTKQQTDLVLTGFGRNYVYPKGKFETKVKVDGDDYTARVYVMSADVMSFDIIVGSNFS